MIVFHNMIYTIVNLLGFILNLYVYVLVARAVISWFSPDPYNNLYRLLINLTEPVLTPIRRYIPTSGIDFSPFIAILIIEFIIKGFIFKTILQLI
ncbi:MAG: YggT family protein [Candidatus Cloacimonetes bacterium]|nr:YggT family protein [Candidatus Cloacimonadota bacterium]